VETSRSILVVDDDYDCRLALRELLEEEGFMVVEAANGQAALDCLVTRHEWEPSLIILDLAMPVVSGWQLVTIIDNYYRLSRIPRLILSAWPFTSDGRAVEGYMAKPYDADVLLSRVHGLLQS
jgi:CheY-like chemotaxis protein